VKILAVRGKNLASLAGHFEVAFDKPPLDHAGLIAITGPTGAGKTTLLDAMCLALFDRTPRFANRGGVVIGGPSEDPSAGLRTTDVRGILRHGAVEGWAEVEFLGVDDHRWRARWEVRRARGRADGRMQFQQMQLIDAIDGHVVSADRKSDTLMEIERRLGLDFDQFRRSVLLAQGEFAAFLEASGGERAELLERMTGTWLYRELGRGAFERAKLAERELDLVVRDRDQLRMLTPEDRARLDAAVVHKRGERRELEANRSAAEAALRWYLRASELEAGLEAARRSLAELDEKRAELEDREALLGRVERVAAVRERLATRDRWIRELGERTRDLEFVRGELPLIEAQIGELQAKLGLDEQQLERARERRRRMAGELERARELDTKLGSGEVERDRVARKLTQAQAARASTEQLLSQLEVGLADATTRLASGREWLEQHAGLGPLAEHWPHYRSLFQQHLRELEQRASLARRAVELRPRRERFEQALGEARRERDAARARLTQARTRLRKIDRELDGLAPLGELRRRQDALDRGRDRLARLRGLYEARERAASVQAELVRERGEQALERDHRVAERRRVEQALALIEQRFAEAQRGLRQLEAMRDLIAHRADLRPGEACPLCGASEHPHADTLAPVDGVLAASRERIEQLLRERDELAREQGEHVGREQLASKRLVAISGRLRELEREQTTLQKSWAEALEAGPLLPNDPESMPQDRAEQAVEAEASGAGQGEDEQLSLLRPSPQLSLLGTTAGPALPDRIDAAQIGPALWSVQEQLDHRARQLARERDEVEALLDKQRDRQARRDEADLALEACRGRLETCTNEHDAVVRELAEVETRAAQLDVEIEARWLELDDVGPAALSALAVGDLPGDFRAQLSEAGADLLARLELGVQRFVAQQRLCEQATEGIRALDTRRAELGSQRQSRIESVATLELELRELDESLAQLRAERAQLLGGRPVAEVARELETLIEIASRDREASKDAIGKVEREHQVQRTRAHTLADQVATLESSRDEAQRSVDVALAEVGLDRATVDELLAREELWADAWQQHTRKTITAARAELERRAAVLGERERVHGDHHREGPPPLARELAEQRRESLEGRDEQLRHELFELEHQLRRDAEDRALADALAPRLQACEHAARLWGRLRDAIGSATGDKFQKFAQSLTLELLLTQANAQLRELKPRYALARVPNHDLELQLVDHDLGDEVRSIRGLSGGEKFLVSLALALALASLSAEDCRIDSLFIDEGFGTLDAQSLDVAVSTLDTLQSEGRQIGVISHVPGLAERIGVEIRVEPVSSGRSRVRVVRC
jgi:exonuclease SbcC